MKYRIEKQIGRTIDYVNVIAESPQKAVKKARKISDMYKGRVAVIDEKGERIILGSKYKVFG